MNPRGKTQRILAIAFAIMTLSLGVSPSHAALNQEGEIITATKTPQKRSGDLFNEYEPQFWDIRDGLPNNRVSAIHFDKHGYLWLGSYFGISRFNGEEFVSFTPYNTPVLKADTISNILSDVRVGQGEWFWISTDKGFYRSNGRSFHDMEMDPSHEDILGMATTEDGAVWLAANGGLARHLNGENKPYDGRNGFDTNQFQSVRVTADGTIILFGPNPKPVQIFDPVEEEFRDHPWKINELIDFETAAGALLYFDAGGYVWYQIGDGIYRFRPGETRERMKENTGTGTVSTLLLAMDSEKRIWVADEDGTILRYTVDQIESIELNPRYRVSQVDTFLEHGNDFWLGSEEGLVHLKKRAVKNYSKLDGLPHDFVSSVAQLTDDKFVVGTGEGPAIIDIAKDEITVVTVNVADHTIRSVCPAPNGGFWISNAHLGPLLIDANFEVHLSPSHSVWEESNNNRVNSLSYDSKGSFWIGAGSGAIQIDTNNTVVHYNTESTPVLPVDDIRAIYEHTDKTVWMGSHGGGLAILSSNVFQVFNTENSNISGNEVFALACDPDEKTVWAATDNGITRIRDGICTPLRRDQGIPAGTINQILFDESKNMYITSLRGVHRITYNRLNVELNEETGIELETVDFNDGMLNAETNGESQPAGIIDTKGFLWIPTIKSVTTFSPDLFDTAATPAPPFIERVLGDVGTVLYDNSGLDGGDQNLLKTGLTLNPDQGDVLEIDLAAPPVSVAATARYETRLSHENGEVLLKVQDTPKAIYTTLEPGKYTFVASVATGKNKWSDASTPFLIEQLPHFYQTLPFYAVLVAVAIGTGLFLHTRRMRYASRIQHLEQNEALITERERIARDMHDDLGSRLTHISLIAEISDREGERLSGEQARELNVAARQAARAVEEIIWSTKPDNDSSENTIDYLILYAEHQLATAGIRCRNNSFPPLPYTRLSPEIRHTVFLTFKEAINNVIKHSNAKEVWLTVILGEDSVTVRIADDGNGFDASKHPNGNHNGLKNMADRMADIGGSFSIRTEIGKGTKVNILFNIPKSGDTQFFRK